MVNSYSITYFLLVICPSLWATEYRYPVGYDKKNDVEYYIHQKNPLDIELYGFDDFTQEYSKLLPNHFNPAGFRLLPNCDGFSFIHNDMIYIKNFSKRSPKRIEFLEPIYGINTIEWIDGQSFYFAGCQHGHYRIYEGTIDGDIEIIINNDNADSLYPQKINNSLFYIERDAQNYYGIIQTIYKSDDPKSTIVDKKDMPIACLSMISETKGFFLTYTPKVTTEDMVIKFSYYQLTSKKQWEVELLFDFSIPCEFLAHTSQTRLYESIVPLLPKYKNEHLYFMDTQKNNGTMDFFHYDIAQKKISPLTDSSKRFFSKK